jgi:hypothetical protein
MEPFTANAPDDPAVLRSGPSDGSAGPSSGFDENRVRLELERASESLRRESDPQRWAALYAVQQSLGWVCDPQMAASPVDVCVSGRVQVPTDIPLAKADCSVVPHPAAS